MAFPNTQTTINTQAPQTGLNKTYYDEKLLRYAKTKFVYQKHGQKRPIPKNRGKLIEMRRWSLWDPNLAMIPLTEGVTPDGLSLAQDIVTTEIQQYGAYFSYADMLELTTFDEITQSGVERLGIMLGTVVEWVTRNELATGNNVYWAGSATSRETITANDKLTNLDLRRAARELKKRKATPFRINGTESYIMIVSPDTAFDIQSDPLWQDANKYVDQSAMYSGIIGTLFGITIIESTEAPIVESSLNDTVSSYNAGTLTITTSYPISEEAKLYLNTGIAQIRINEAETVDVASATGTTITLAAAPSTAPAAGNTIRSLDGTLSNIPVHQSICFGQDAYGVIEIASGGSVQSIIKGLGEGGYDPLNQRGTVGGKVMAYAAKILNEDWILRVEHAVTG